MYGFDQETIRKIYTLATPCYEFLDESDMVEWNYFFYLFTYPEE
jgi:hypothetical protein